MNSCSKTVYIPLIVFAIAFLIFRMTSLDLIISDFAYERTSFVSCFWLTNLAFLGKYLCVPFCFFLLYNFCSCSKNKYFNRREVIFCLTVLVIGPGLITNYLLKPGFNRPRPYEIERYNDTSEVLFVPLLSIGEHSSSTSFSSGHAGAAFFFIVPWFIGRLREKYSWKLLVPAFLFGGVISACRILQGKHFFSDCLGSLTVVYFSALILSYCFKVNDCQKDHENKKATSA